HDIDHPNMPLVTAPIRIGAGAWVCAEAYVHPGVEIGVDAVVGVRAVVLHDVPPGQVVGGHPAKFLRMREVRKAE
ncbi:colanic acid biosynthesis acetyltransferase WcaF, partial [Dolichospermum sp. ST_sed1]|nr:colanic acid biosynthesis acetyltransferase WcaF [Dolichospermum sp. ST_sed1]